MVAGGHGKGARCLVLEGRWRPFGEQLGDAGDVPGLGRVIELLSLEQQKLKPRGITGE